MYRAAAIAEAQRVSQEEQRDVELWSRPHKSGRQARDWKLEPHGHDPEFRHEMTIRYATKMRRPYVGHRAPKDE